MTAGEEGDVTLAEVRRAIRSKSWGKAPGPDGFHAVSYTRAMRLCSPQPSLTDLFDDCLKDGALLPTIKEGIRTMLFKKDPLDMSTVPSLC